MVEGTIINKILVNGGVAINILLKCMLRRFGKTINDLILHNIVVFYFCGKTSVSNGLTYLDVFVGIRRRLIVFVVVSSQASFNMLLGREWIQGMMFLRQCIRKSFFFCNKDGKLEVVEVDQTSYRFYAFFVDESNQTLVVIVTFEIEDSYYVNKKTSEKNMSSLAYSSFMA